MSPPKRDRPFGYPVSSDLNDTICNYLVACLYTNLLSVLFSELFTIVSPGWHTLGPCISQSRLSYKAVTNNSQIFVPSNRKGLFLSHAKCPSQVGSGRLWGCSVLMEQATPPNVPSDHTIEVRALEGLALANTFQN